MHVHRRKSSREESDEIVPNGSLELHPGIDISSPSRTRVSSTPSQPAQDLLQPQPAPPPSAGPFRTSFGAPRPPTNGVSNHHRHPSSPFRSSFSVPAHPNANTHSHSRTRSVSGGPFSPPLPSPLATSFSSQQPPSSASFPSSSLSNGPYPFPTSSTAPELTITPETPDSPNPANGGGPPSPKQSRRHSRLHSRNLSVFFPRPGSLPHTAIAEDGVQELELGVPPDVEAPVSVIPSAGSRIPDHKGLQGFTFGGRPGAHAQPMMRSGSGGGASRRGHHHKHSLSHNFFSFLEPGAQMDDRVSAESRELHTQPTPTPISPWNPVSPFSASAGPTQTAFTQNGYESSKGSEISGGSYGVQAEISTAAVVSATTQFILGAWLWVSGQQIGSLACTGLGYWVVFDSFGVALSNILPGYLAKKSMQAKVRRPYGNSRIETVGMFAQSVYLMFSSVYVCKETFEHFLLSAGEGHHHHRGDEDPDALGMEFPLFLTFMTLLSLVGTAIFFNNHSKLVNITDNRIPSLPSLLRSLRSRYPSPLSYSEPLPTSQLALLLSNPFTASPIFFCISILSISAFIHPSNFRYLDLVLASTETVVTFKVAYRASVVLGTVLLQTSPERGLTGGRMEAFLRAMREIERHPKVLHLPAPHIWQLTPTHTQTSSSSQGLAQSLVVTLELHVRDDLGDDDLLELTRWAWERCVGALHFGSRAGRSVGLEGGTAEAEVTVGVVRG